MPLHTPLPNSPLARAWAAYGRALRALKQSWADVAAEVVEDGPESLLQADVLADSFSSADAMLRMYKEPPTPKWCAEVPRKLYRALAAGGDAYARRVEQEVLDLLAANRPS